jgi:large subunit ribosomal protein L4
MANVTVKTVTGDDKGRVELDAATFGIEPNAAVLHQVVTAQLAARRAGTHSTKTRAERRGGGAKPWRQKGTGRARHGSIRSPQWRGGGIVGGPKPRNYAQKTPKKMIKLALRSALSDRAADGKVIVVDEWGFGDVPTTRQARLALEALGVTGRALVVLTPDQVVEWKSFRNLPDVHLIESTQLNAYDVLVSDLVVFTRATLPGADGAESLAQRATSAQAKAEPKATKAAAKPATKAPEKPAAEPVEDAADTEAPAKKTVKKKVIKKVVKKKVVKKKVVKKKAAPTEDGDES